MAVLFLLLGQVVGTEGAVADLGPGVGSVDG
jgi:hypothetical protein